MNITELSIKRPAMMSMVIMFFIVLGLYTYNRIGVELFPAVNVPYVTVMTQYTGAGAEEIETQIVKPMEDSLSSLSKVKNITSIASEGMALTILEFDLSADADTVREDVQKRIDSFKGRLPSDAEEPEVIKRDMADVPVMVLALKSTKPVNELDLLANDLVKERLQKVSGVSDITVVGSQEREVHINVDRAKLTGYGLNLNQIINRLKAENLNQPSGRLDHPDAEYNLRVLGEFASLENIRNIEIPLGDGSVVRLKEVADINFGYQEQRELNRLNQQDSIGLIVFKQSDASVVQVADDLLVAIDSLQKQLPSDTKLVVSRNVAEFIQLSLESTRRSIIEGIIFTALALLIFLKDWRSLLIVILAIPTSLLATLMLIYFAGYTFNMMSLMGLALCIGILVDDSIVVLENIHRHLEMGKPPRQAALEGRMEIGMAAVAITLSDVVVFAPIAFMSGMVGQFFRQFGLTIVFATLFSLFISFTLTPMLSSRLFKQRAPKQNGELAPGAEQGPRLPRRSILAMFWQVLDRIGAKVQTFYVLVLHWALENRKKVIFIALGAFICSFIVFPLKLVGFEFMPKADQNEINITLEMPTGTPLGKTNQTLQIIEQYLDSIPEIQYQQTSLGSSGGNFGASSGAHIGRIGVTLVGKSQRERTVWQVGDQIRNWAKAFPKGRIKVSESDSMGGGGAAINIEVTGNNTNELVKIANKVKTVVSSIEGARDIDHDWRLGQPEIQFNIMRDRAANLGLSVTDIANAVRTSISGGSAGVLREGDEDRTIVVRLADIKTASLAELGNIPITNASGVQVRLNQVAEIKEGVGPTQIRRINRDRVITITGNIENRVLNDFLTEAQAKVDGLNLPPGYDVKFTGQAEAMQETMGDLVAALVLSIVLVYMVLVMLYESFSTPFIRMLSLPLGIVGALIALAVSHNSLNLFSMIGIIMLDGLVAKNGTLLLDYTITLQERGYALKDALIEAGKVRLRPIMMTTITMIFGMLPTALAMGEGAETRAGMGWVLIGGLITSTIFTLVIIPVAAIIIDNLKQKISRLFQRV